MAMNPEIKAKWIAALRSGEYKQGRSFLYRDGHHCCLGVLCAIQGETFEGWTTGQSLSAVVPDEYNQGLLSHQSMKLAQMNDDGVSFGDIADELERKELI